jgi:hypothetical protein
MNFDGTKMLGGLGSGVVLTSPKGDKLHYVLQIHFNASNNVTEYEALVHGLKLASRLASGGSSASEILPLWCTRSQETRTLRMPTWPPTASTSSSSVGSLKVVSSITSQSEQ